jgi:site-specific DNA recombinase
MGNTHSQKFFLYCRKSTDVEDKQVLSIEAQITELREFTKKENLRVVKVFIEKQTAKIPGRPIFNKMLERIEKSEANGILAWHPDRLARNSVDGGRIIYLLDTGKLQSLKFPQFWFEPTPQGKFMLSIAFGQSKYYVDSLSENTKRGLRQKVRRGEYPGLAPIGYLNDVRTKTIVVNRKRSKIVKQAFELYSKGNFTLGEIANFLAKNGIKTKNGNPYKRDKISFILSNPFYYGHFRYAGELHEGKHEPIIAKKLFDKVQEVLKQRGRPRKEKIPKAFCGLLRCGECGMMITGEQKTKYYKGTNRTVIYIYYRCTKKSKNHKCNQKFIRQEELDKQLSSMIQKVSLRQDWAEWMFNRLKQEEKLSAQSCFAFVQENREKIQQLRQKLQFLLDSYLDQVIEREVYLEKKSEIMGQIKTLEEQTIRFEQKQNDWFGPMKNWINEAANAAKIARESDLSAKKELLWKIYGSDLYLKDKKTKGEAKFPYAALAAKGGAASAANSCLSMERVTGVEPVSSPWQGDVEPLNYTRR